MKLVLVLTPARPGERRKFTAPPLSLLYLGTYIKNLGHEVKIIDADVAGFTLDELAQKLVDEKADLIGITVMTPFSANVLNLCKRIKEKDKDSKICLGGIHITTTGVEMMQESPHVDYMVFGEGEYALSELLKALEGKKEIGGIANLVYRDKESGEIIKNEPRPLIQGLDSLPIPDFSLIENLNFKNYDEFHSGGKRVINILGSRGCPFLCTFCAAHLIHGRQARFRSAKNIVDEIEFNQKKYGTRYVSFKDSTFTFNHAWIKEICEEILSRDLKVGFCVNARVDTITEELLEIMTKAGCRTIGFGIESGSQKILNTLKKGTKIAQIHKALDLSNKFGLTTITAFMIGNPGETKADIEKSLELAKSIKADAVAFNILTAFPGTEVYVDALKEGTLKDPKWYLQKNSERPGEFLAPGPTDGTLTSQEFDSSRELKNTYHRFYFRPKYVLCVAMRIVKNPYFFKYAWDYAMSILKRTFANA